MKRRERKGKRSPPLAIRTLHIRKRDSSRTIRFFQCCLPSIGDYIRSLIYSRAHARAWFADERSICTSFATPLYIYTESISLSFAIFSYTAFHLLRGCCTRGAHGTLSTFSGSGKTNSGSRGKTEASNAHARVIGGSYGYKYTWIYGMKIRGARERLIYVVTDRLLWDYWALSPSYWRGANGAGALASYIPWFGILFVYPPWKASRCVTPASRTYIWSSKTCFNR